MLNLVLFGPPGSGKGTQAENIVTKYKLIHLSTGDMLRAEIAAQTALGLEAKKLMDKGDLVPDTVVIGMIENKLDNNKSAAGFVFDGFPRTVKQAEALDELLAKHNAPIAVVLSLKVGEDELTRRILNRGQTSGRADDQNESIVKNRVIEYRTKTEPLANYYAAQGKLKEITGERSVEEVAGSLAAEIDKASSALGGKTNGGGVK
jgi:adenylate kinase